MQCRVYSSEIRTQDLAVPGRLRYRLRYSAPPRLQDSSGGGGIEEGGIQRSNLRGGIGAESGTD